MGGPRKPEKNPEVTFSGRVRQSVGAAFILKKNTNKLTNEHTNTLAHKHTNTLKHELTNTLTPTH